MPSDIPPTIKMKSPDQTEQNGDSTMPQPDETLVNEKAANLEAQLKAAVAKSDRIAEKLSEQKEENKKLHLRALEAERKVKVGTVEARSMRIYVELLNGLVATGALDPAALLKETRDNTAAQKRLETLLAHYAGVAQVAEITAKEKGF